MNIAGRGNLFIDDKLTIEPVIISESISADSQTAQQVHLVNNIEESRIDVPTDKAKEHDNLQAEAKVRQTTVQLGLSHSL